MAGVRHKKSQKKKRVNSTVTGRKQKKKNKTKVLIHSKTIRKAWDKSKSAKENFKVIGLCYDTNSKLPIENKKGQAEKMDTDAVPNIQIQNSVYINELEAEASNGCKKERHIAPGEAQYLWSLIKDYGDNYEKMARDKRNYYQQTACQLKRKCERFLNSSQDFSSYLNQ